MGRESTRRWALVALAAAVPLVVPACSDPSTARAPATTTSAPTPTTSAEAMHHGGPISPEDLRRVAAAGYVELPGPDNMWGYVGPRPGGETVDGPDLERKVRAEVTARGWATVEGGRADGFERLSPVSDPRHYFNREYLDDGISYDPARPESLVYDDETGELLAVMFMVPAGSHGAEVVGTDAVWHIHAVSMCFGTDLMMPLSFPTDGVCPRGETYEPWSSEMLHVWLVGAPFAARMSPSG